MKVIYKKSIVEKIIEEIYKARCDNKEIEEILLNDSEWQELSKVFDGFLIGSHTRYYGISIKKEAVE